MKINQIEGDVIEYVFENYTTEEIVYLVLTDLVFAKEYSSNEAKMFLIECIVKRDLYG